MTSCFKFCRVSKKKNMFYHYLVDASRVCIAYAHKMWYFNLNNLFRLYEYEDLLLHWFDHDFGILKTHVRHSSLLIFIVVDNDR